jgi:CTP:molybdopterin cytidylyltransferase MocA
LFYKEWYFRRGYKALRRIKLERGLTGKPRPMVEYILNTLRNTDCIDKILVVGPEKEIRKKIDPDLLSGGSNIELIQQKESYGHNVKKGYDCAGEKYVLFVTSDSPTTKQKDVSEFIGICRELYTEYDLIYPFVKESFLKTHHKTFPRPFFRMIPDTIFPVNYIDDEDIRENGAAGFRITSMAFANLEGFPVKRIDEAYNLRKFYRKSSRDRLKEIFGENLIRRYRQGLKMSEIEKMFFNYEGLRLKIVGLKGAGASLDIDSTKDVKRFQNLYL